MNRLLDVFHLLRSRTHKTQVELAAHLVMELSGNADATRFCEWFQPRRHIDPVTKEVVALNYHVPHVKPHPELHPVFRRNRRVAVPHVLLELDSRYYRIHRTTKLRNYGISGATEDAPVIGLDGLIGDSTANFEVM